MVPTEAASEIDPLAANPPRQEIRRAITPGARGQPAEVAAAEVAATEVPAAVIESGVGGVGSIARSSRIPAPGIAGLAALPARPEVIVEERLGDRGADEARGEGRQEPASETEARVPAPGTLDRPRLADLRPGRGTGERGRVVAAQLTRRDVLGKGLRGPGGAARA